MGVIRKESVKQGIVTYIGVGIGVINTLWINPLSFEIYGLAQFILAMATMLMPFATMGITGLVTRFFPEFSDKPSGHHGFLGLLLLATTGAFLLFLPIIWLLQQPFIHLLEYLKWDVNLFTENAGLILLLTYLLAITWIMIYQSYNIQRFLVPSILNNLVVKIGLPILILLYYFSVLDEGTFKIGYLLMYLSIVAGMAIYLYLRNEWHLRPDFSFLNPPLTRQMINYAIYGILGSAGSIMALQIDAIMVPSLVGTAKSGIYNNLAFIASTIEIPNNVIFAIVAPFIAAAMNAKDMAEAKNLYQKTSLNLLIIGLYLLMGIWLCSEDLFRLTSDYEKYASARYVILLLGIAKVFNMSTSTNFHIIGFSRYYRFNLYAVVGLAMVNIVTNQILIQKFHLIGAAMATLISILFFGIIRFVFTLVVFKIHPFTKETVTVLLIGALTWLLTWLTPSTGLPLLNILIKGSIVTGVFGGLILYLKVSKDVNDLAQSAINRALKILGRDQQGR